MPYKIVTLDCPVDSWSDPETTRYFHQAVGLKLQGYGHEYPYGVIAVDGTDFIATHILICKEAGRELKPALAYKSISLERCRTFEQVFPPLGIARGAGALGHVRAINELIQRGQGHAAAVRYCSAYTIDPPLREDRALIRQLKDFFVGTHVNFHQHEGTRESLLCGVVRFKVDRMFESWGYRALRSGETELPSIHQATLKGEEVRMFSLPGFSAEALEFARQFKRAWDTRIVISSKKELKDARIAA